MVIRASGYQPKLSPYVLTYTKTFLLEFPLKSYFNHIFFIFQLHAISPHILPVITIHAYHN